MGIRWSYFFYLFPVLHKIHIPNNATQKEKQKQTEKKKKQEWNKKLNFNFKKVIKNLKF